MDFFKTYLRIKSSIRKITKMSPIYKKLPKIKAIIKAVHVVKQRIHAKSFKKKTVRNEFEQDLFIKRYSI
jgi:hypothetical protein